MEIFIENLDEVRVWGDVWSSVSEDPQNNYGEPLS